MTGRHKPEAGAGACGAAPVPANRVRVRGLNFAILLLALTVPGCIKALELPPQATYTEIVPSGRAARPPNCNIPVLRHEPLVDFHKVGLVEATGSVYAHESDVLPVVISKACESGADAIVILTSKSQTTEGLVGYYIDAEAIVYDKKPPIPGGHARAH
jgi:hypothetical protein